TGDEPPRYLGNAFLLVGDGETFAAGVATGQAGQHCGNCENGALPGHARSSSCQMIRLQYRNVRATTFSHSVSNCENGWQCVVKTSRPTLSTPRSATLAQNRSLSPSARSRQLSRNFQPSS